MAALVPVMYAYGLVGAAFTHSPWPAPALVTFLFYGIVALAEHRSDAGNIAWTLTTAQASALLIGSIVGLLFVAAFRTPRLIDDRAFYSWDSVRARGLPPARSTWDPLLYPWTMLVILATVAFTAGVYCLLGGLWHDNDGTAAMMTQQQAVAWGIALAVLGGGGIIAGLLQVWRTRAPTGLPGRLTAKYLLIAVAVTVVPQLVWTLPFVAGAAARVFGTVVVTALLWLAVAWFSADIFLGQPQVRIRGFTALAVLALVHCTAWIAAYIAIAADNGANAAAGSALLAVAIAGLVWAGVLACLSRIWSGPPGAILQKPTEPTAAAKPQRTPATMPAAAAADDDSSEGGAASVPVATQRTYLPPAQDGGQRKRNVPVQEYLFP